jgi:exonuclease SbcC
LDIRNRFEKLNNYNIDDEEYVSLKQDLESCHKQKELLKMKMLATETKINTMNDQIIALKKEIKLKLEAKAKLKYVERLYFWLNDYFIKLMQTMEKNIMLRVHSDFSHMFEKWFFLLVNSENMNVKLDDTFSPQIEQNGYLVEYENLSGGEKTAAALAYRLALNQIINNLMTTINTKDIIILDEPTDGFSSEQLDKVRDLLNDLDLAQLIIVSHEQKVETFVDNVIKFVKNDHVTQVIM